VFTVGIIQCDVDLLCGQSRRRSYVARRTSLMPRPAKKHEPYSSSKAPLELRGNRPQGKQLLMATIEYLYH